jgi:hypothetical protein
LVGDEQAHDLVRRILQVSKAIRDIAWIGEARLDVTHHRETKQHVEHNEEGDAERRQILVLQEIVHAEGYRVGVVAPTQKPPHKEDLARAEGRVRARTTEAGAINKCTKGEKSHQRAEKRNVLKLSPRVAGASRGV